MTTFSTYLAASLLAVTFGWVPAEPPQGTATPSTPSTPSSQSAPRGYDYLVKLSPEDLESLRSGDAPELVSNLPTDIGPIERIRVYVGEGEAPRRLLARDENSPKQIAAAAKKLHTVAKPVTPEQPVTSEQPVTPEWPDAARLLEDNSSAQPEEPAAGERRTSYQNPDVLNLRGLSDGFKEGTRAVAEGTQRIFEKSGEEIQRAGQDLLNGASNVLEGNLPGSQPANPYAGRPNANQPAPYQPNAYQADPRDAAQQAQFQQSQGATGYPNQNYPAQNYPTQPSQPAYNQPGYPDPYANTAAPRSVGLAEDFASTAQDAGAPAYNAPNDNSPSYNNPSRPVVPLARTPQPAATTRATDFNAFKTADDFGGAASAPLSPPAWPELSAPQNPNYTSGGQPASTPTWNDNNYAGATGGGFASDRDFSPPATTTAVGTNAANTGWAGATGTASGAYPQADTASLRRDVESRYFEKLLLVILGAATCFTWIAYIDVRNKYRSILRNTPGGAYSTAA